MEHTKLPWKVDWTFPTSQSPCRILGDGEIARVTFRGKGADGNAEANAAFIVKAANNFEDMVRTLKLFMEAHDLDYVSAMADDADRHPLDEVFDAARAILDKIEKGG